MPDRRQERDRAQEHAQLEMLLTTPVVCRKFVKSMELNIVSKRLLLEHRAFILKSRMTQVGVRNEHFLHHRCRGRHNLCCRLLRVTRMNKQTDTTLT